MRREYRLFSYRHASTSWRRLRTGPKETCLMRNAKLSLSKQCRRRRLRSAKIKNASIRNSKRLWQRLGERYKKNAKNRSSKSKTANMQPSTRTISSTKTLELRKIGYVSRLKWVRRPSSTQSAKLTSMLRSKRARLICSRRQRWKASLTRPKRPINGEWMLQCLSPRILMCDWESSKGKRVICSINFKLPRRWQLERFRDLGL